MGHLEQCKASVLAYARSLAAAVTKKQLNRSAVTGLIKSYLEQPAYYPEHRTALLELGLSVFE